MSRPRLGKAFRKKRPSGKKKAAMGEVNTEESSNDQEDQEQQPQAQEESDHNRNYLPPYLRGAVWHYHGDFYQTPIFHPQLIVQLMAEGFLPIATRGVLLPKLHEQRCVIQLPSRLHISRSVRKKARKYHVTLNQNFAQVVQGCNQQHRHCWLYPPLVAAFQAILDQGGIDAVLEPNGSRERPRAKVRIYSVEVWNTSTRTLVAGELGYTVGSIYTSLTGFSKEDSAGSVQLAALGSALCRSHFELWDLGMDMNYKQSLGAECIKRADFVDFVHRVRQDCSQTVLTMENGTNARTLIDTFLAAQQPKEEPAANHDSKNHNCRKSRDESPPKRPRRTSPANGIPRPLAS